MPTSRHKPVPPDDSPPRADFAQDTRIRVGEQTDDPVAWDDLSPSERNPLRLYLNEIGKTPLLSAAEETALARRILAGDDVARDAMIRANLRLVVRIARDYENFGLPLLDLIAEGNIGLMKAVGRFDPDRGGKLSSYAAWWIRQAIKRALASHGKTIRLPVHLVERISLMRRTARSLQDELRRDPTDDELALVMGLPVRKIVHMKTVATRAASLDAPVGEDGDATFGDLIGDDSQSDPLEHLLGKNAADEIRDCVARLDVREAEIIRLRFGLDGENVLTLEEIGERFGLTRERIRQVERLAILKLRRSIAERERRRTAEDLRDEALADARKREINDYLLQKKAETEERRARLRRAVKFTPPPFVAPAPAPERRSRDTPPSRPIRRTPGNLPAGNDT